METFSLITSVSSRLNLSKDFTKYIDCFFHQEKEQASRDGWEPVRHLTGSLFAWGSMELTILDRNLNVVECREISFVAHLLFTCLDGCLSGFKAVWGTSLS